MNTFEIRRQDSGWWLVYRQDGRAWAVERFTHHPEVGTLVTLVSGEAFRFGPGQVQVREEVVA